MSEKRTQGRASPNSQTHFHTRAQLSPSQSCLPPLCLPHWCPISNLRCCPARIYCGPSYHSTLHRLRPACWLTCPAVLPCSGLILTTPQTPATAPLSKSSHLVLPQWHFQLHSPGPNSQKGALFSHSYFCFQNLPSPSFLTARAHTNKSHHQTTGQLGKVRRDCR